MPCQRGVGIFQGGGGVLKATFYDVPFLNRQGDMALFQNRQGDITISYNRHATFMILGGGGW